VSELTDFLDQCGIDYVEKTGRLSILCPFHDDTDPSSGFYLDTELFHCFACSLTLPPDRFYARLREISLKEARKTTDRIWPENLQVVEVDKTELLRLRNRGEEVLEAKRDLGFEEHAKLAEDLDLILMSYERGLYSLNLTHKEYEDWTNKLTGPCVSSKSQEEKLSSSAQM